MAVARGTGRAGVGLPAAGRMLEGAFYLAYPLVVYVAHTRLGTRGVGGILLVLYVLSFLLRMRGSAGEVWAVVRQHLALVAVIALAIASGSRQLLLLLPTLVSAYLLGTFAWSLHRGPPMVERFARLVEDDLPDFTLPYCRKVTALWCAFFVANGVAVTALAFAAPLEWWALYTGVIFYVLLGALLAGEVVFRKWWFRYYRGGALDRFFARLFPAEKTANGRRSLAYDARRAASREIAEQGARS
jgi:uncharacterized membrane protein